MAIISDPVEQTKEYLEAMKKIQPMLDEEFPQDKMCMGMCHSYWYRKKELLKRAGIKWKTPSEMNPDVHFD